MKLDLSHPAFEQPTDPSATVWRYMSLAKLVQLIHKEALYFNLVSTFQDPAEGRVPFSNRRRWASRVVSACEMARDTSAVNCWHMREHESVHMWRSYCGLSEGIALRSTYERLCQSFRSIPSTLSDQQVVALGRVRYLDFEEDLLETSNGLAPIMCKRKAFEDEREVRAVIFPDWHLRNMFTQRAIEGVFMPVDFAVLIDRVVVAPEAPQWFLELVKSLVGERHAVSRSSLALPDYPRTSRDGDLTNRIEAEARKILNEKRRLESTDRDRLMLAALGNGWVFRNQEERTKHDKEVRFTHKFIEWLLDNPPPAECSLAGSDQPLPSGDL